MGLLLRFNVSYPEPSVSVSSRGDALCLPTVWAVVEGCSELTSNTQEAPGPTLLAPPV